jgi:hypothetical protein
MRMRISLYLALLLTCLPGVVFARPQSLPAKSSDHLGQTEAEAQKALGSGRLVLSEAGNEYMLLPPKPTVSGSKESATAWSYSDKSLSPRDSVKVDVQVGVRDGKPVFIPVLFPKEKADSVNQDSAKLFTLPQGQLPNDPHVRKCSNGRECVRICIDETGKRYCCRWQCVKSQ